MYFDPFSPEALSSHLELLLRLSSSSRASYIEEGLEHAARYSWESAAKDTWHILQLATNG